MLHFYAKLVCLVSKHGGKGDPDKDGNCHSNPTLVHVSNAQSNESHSLPIQWVDVVNNERKSPDGSQLWKSMLLDITQPQLRQSPVDASRQWRAQSSADSPYFLAWATASEGNHSHWLGNGRNT